MAQAILAQAVQLQDFEGGSVHRWLLEGISASAMALPMKTKTTVMKKPGAKGVKALKATRARRLRVARGRMAKSQVVKGTKDKTAGGLKASDIVLNRNGKLVSKKRSAVSSSLPWPRAVAAARKALGLTGFVLINRGPEGKALYAKVKALLAA
uniref:Uncharacterized protein n=1 Tax=Alexandrium monilatum TaxID=311494 RepID=A0A7S4SLI5_9DINO